MKQGNVVPEGCRIFQPLAPNVEMKTLLQVSSLYFPIFRLLSRKVGGRCFETEMRGEGRLFLRDSRML